MLDRDVCVDLLCELSEIWPVCRMYFLCGMTKHHVLMFASA